MGKFSTQLLLDTSEGISNLRGKVFRIGGRIIFPINHPAAALYTPSRVTILMEDFQKIKSLLKSNAEQKEDKNILSTNKASSSTGVDNGNNKSEQLGLF